MNQTETPAAVLRDALIQAGKVIPMLKHSTGEIVYFTVDQLDTVNSGEYERLTVNGGNNHD